MLGRRLGAFLGILLYSLKSILFNLFWLVTLIVVAPFLTIYQMSLWLFHTAQEDLTLAFLSFFLLFNPLVLPIILCIAEIYFLTHFLYLGLGSLIQAIYKGYTNGVSADWQRLIYGLFNEGLHLTSAQVFSSSTNDLDFPSINEEDFSQEQELIVEEYDKLAEILTKEEHLHLKKMSDKDKVLYLNRFFLTNAEIKETKAQVHKSSAHVGLVKTYNRYKGLNKRLQEVNKVLTGELSSLEDGDELIGATDIKNPVLLVKQYSDQGTWFVVPFSTNISDEEQFSQLICKKSSDHHPKHPLQSEDLLQPNLYEVSLNLKKLTRYIWHPYVGYSQEVHEAAIGIRRVLQKVAKEEEEYCVLSHPINHASAKLTIWGNDPNPNRTTTDLNKANSSNPSFS